MESCDRSRVYHHAKVNAPKSRRRPRQPFLPCPPAKPYGIVCGQRQRFVPGHRGPSWHVRNEAVDGNSGMMATIRINDTTVQVADGATILEAARAAGVNIPTLCHLDKLESSTACLICVVKDVSTGRLIPSCAARITDGMHIVTDDDEIHEARRAVLTMLLDEHVGDCEAPCSRTCPAGLDIPRMMRYTEAGDTEAAARLAQRDLIFPGTLGRLCSAPCERVCRRAQYDAPVAIRDTHAAFTAVSAPERVASNGKCAAVVGAGLAGLAAGRVMTGLGYTCRVFEKRDRPCAALRAEMGPACSPAMLDAEIAVIRDAGVEIVCGAETAPDALLAQYDVVIVACDTPHHSSARLFAAHETPMHVRAVANGKQAAQQAHAFLQGRPTPEPKRFQSALGELTPQSLSQFAAGRLRTDAASEAARCLHCGCLKRVSCRLRTYATEYGLGPRIKHTMPPPEIEAVMTAGDVCFESGKCIKCGICVGITRAAGIKPGLAFTGRGLASRVRPALGATLAEGLGAVAAECVVACPTAALAFRGADETS